MTELSQVISKEEIQAMPVVKYEGKIVVVSTASEAEKCCDFLRKQPLVGIDTETKPSFHKGESRKVALLQVSTLDICFLIRLNMIGLTEPIKKMLSSRKTLKVGLSLHDDILALRHRGEFRPGKYEDIQKIVPLLGIKDLSLQKIYANVFKQKISKSQRLSNWEADVLTEAQKRYAATDAWACVKLHNKLMELQQTHDYTLKLNADEQQQQSAQDNP